MARTPKKSDLDLVLEKIDDEIAALQAMRVRIINTIELVTLAASRKPSHKKKNRAEPAPAGKGSI